MAMAGQIIAWKCCLEMPGDHLVAKLLLVAIKQAPHLISFTLWSFNIAMENGPFIDGLPGFTY
jgi:hypothetical protein